MCSIVYTILRVASLPEEINERSHRVAMIAAMLAELAPQLMKNPFQAVVYIGVPSPSQRLREVRLTQLFAAVLTGTEQFLCEAIVTLVPNPCAARSLHEAASALMTDSRIFPGFQGQFPPREQVQTSHVVIGELDGLDANLFW